MAHIILQPVVVVVQIATQSSAAPCRVVALLCCEGSDLGLREPGRWRGLGSVLGERQDRSRLVGVVTYWTEEGIPTTCECRKWLSTSGERACYTLSKGLEESLEASP